jgi:hypothetical protein
LQKRSKKLLSISARQTGRGMVALWQPIINDKKFQGIILIFAKTGACAGNVEN